METVELPSGFVDQTPRRGVWRPTSEHPEPNSWDNQVLLADGSTSYGVFLPESGWYIRGAYPKVLGWRKSDNQQITCGQDARAVRPPTGPG